MDHNYQDNNRPNLISKIANKKFLVPGTIIVVILLVTGLMGDLLNLLGNFTASLLSMALPLVVQLGIFYCVGFGILYLLNTYILKERGLNFSNKKVLHVVRILIGLTFMFAYNSF